MKRMLFLLFTSCTASYPSMSEWGQRTPARKEELKLMALQRKLDSAEEERQRAIDEVESLQTDVQRAQIAFVAKQVELYERQIQRLSKDPQRYAEFLQTEANMLFLKEREMLRDVIHDGTPNAAFEAQQMLDRILRFITMLNDERRLDSERLVR